MRIELPSCASLHGEAANFKAYPSSTVFESYDGWYLDDSRPILRVSALSSMDLAHLSVKSKV